jgi:hypothetical protein
MMGIRWDATKTEAKITADGLNVSGERSRGFNVFPERGFNIAAKECRKDNFPGIITHYFEVRLVALSAADP